MSARLLPAVAVLAAACAWSTPGLAQFAIPPQSKPIETSPPLQGKVQKQFPLSMQWTLVSLNGKAITDSRPTVMIDDALRARGFGGCNTFSATAYPLPQQRFVVGPIALTKRACDKAVMDQEKAFLVLFRTSLGWDVKDGQLILAGSNGQLKFERTL